MRRIRKSFVLVPAVAGLMLFAVSTALTATNASNPILIGAAIGETGFMNPYDGPPAQAAQIAIDEINKSGGLLGQQLKLEIADTHSDINQGGNAAIKLLDKGAKLLIVSCDFDFGGPAALEAQKRGVLAFSTCAASTKFGPQGIGPLAFTMATSAPAQASILAEWAYKKRKWRTAYTLTDTSIDVEKQTCAAFKTRFTQLGGKVVGEDTFQQADASIASQITRMKGLNQKLDVLALCSYQPGGAKALRQIRAAGINVPMVSSEDWDGSYWQKAVPNVSNVYFVTYGSIFGDDPDPKVNRIFSLLKKQGHPAPTAHALTGYAVIEGYAKAVRRAKSFDSSAVRTQLEKFKNEPLIVGPTTFTSKYHIQFYRSMRLIQVQRAKDHIVGIFRAKSVPIPTH